MLDRIIKECPRWVQEFTSNSQNAESQLPVGNLHPPVQLWLGTLWPWDPVPGSLHWAPLFAPDLGSSKHSTAHFKGGVLLFLCWGFAFLCPYSSFGMTLNRYTGNSVSRQVWTILLIPGSALPAHLRNVTESKEASTPNLPQNVSSNHGKRQRSAPKPDDSRMMHSSQLLEVSQLTPHGMNSPLAVAFLICKVMVHIFWELNCCIPSSEYIYSKYLFWKSISE